MTTNAIASIQLAKELRDGNSAAVPFSFSGMN